MHARYVFATLMVLIWAVPAHAQYRERERFHEHFREREHGLPPASIPAEPRRIGFDDHGIPRRPVEPVRSGRGGDGAICDNTNDNPDAAVAACGRIIARGPVRNGYSLALAHVHRGQAYENKDDHVLAIADFSAAIRLQPREPGYFVMRAAATEKSGDTEAARDDYRRAIALDPKNQLALNGLGRIETRSAASVASSMAPQPAATVSPPPPVPTAPSSTPIAAPPPAVDPRPATVATASPPMPAARDGSKTLVAAAATAASVASAPAVPVVAVAASPVVAAPSATPNASHGARVALVIGNGAYVNANALPNPPHDAHAIAEVLRKIGFDVEEGENLGHAAMESQLRAFLHKAANASIVLLFYAGHGMQVDGKNYLVPVDAKLAEASDLPFETIEIDKLLDTLGDPGHTNIILLDACRDNPLARSFASHLPATRSAAVATGLAPYSAVGTGTLIAYATAPGQTALDGQGKDSPFTTSLLHFLPTPGLEIRQVLTRVRAEVATETSNKQIPWDNSSLMGDVVLVKQEP